MDSCLPTEAVRPGSTDVFVAGTAYNYLGVCRALLPESRRDVEMSDSKLHRLRFPDAESAAAGFAVLSSRVVYWLWLAIGDGFHVSRGFVERVPFDLRSLAEADRCSLASLGARLWSQIQADRVVSVNRGRYTVSYRPHSAGDTRSEIDLLLLRAVGLPDAFLTELRGIERATVVVDPNDDRRKHLHTFFNSEDSPE